jgi:tetratricopeptide (TPR) repeat protein/predicted nucleic acid-binding protein
MAQMHLDRFEDAVDTARLLRQIEAPEVAIMREMDALMAQEKFQPVIELYTANVSEIPELGNQAHAVCLYAAALFGSLETEAAIQQLEKAKIRFPKHPLVLLEEAHIREDLGEVDQAEASFVAAAKSATGAYAFHAKQQLGLFYYRQENWIEAEKYLLAGIDDPVHAPFIVRYLICLYQLERFPKCLELAEQLIKQGEFEEMVWELATNCYLRLDDLRSAEHLLEELVRHSAHLRHWLKLFGVTYRLHDIGRARKVLERARAKHSDSFELLVNLSGVEFTTRRYKEAFDLAIRAVEVKPDDSEGHHAVVRSALFAPDSLKFSEAQKKQVQASLARLSGQEGSALQSIDLSDDLSNLREILRQASETAAEAEKLFSTKGLPMTFLSQVLGRSPFQIWAGLTAHQQLFVPMAHGSAEEQQQEATLAHDADEVVVEISSLFTLKMLNMLHILPKLFQKVFVPTAVFECVRVEVDQSTAFKPPTRIIAFEQGQLVRADVPAETHEIRKVFVTDLLAFLKSGAVILSGIQPIVWESETLQKTIESLGNTAGHPIAIAKACGVPLYSDDRGLRALAKNEHAVAGFCTQALLRAAVAKDVITPDVYQDALLELFRNNYNFVSESAETVIRGLQKAKYAITPLTQRLVLRVAEPNANKQATAGISGYVLADIWVNAGSTLREQWLDLAAKNLPPGKDFLDLCGTAFKGMGVSLLRFPALFFGLTNAIARTAHFSPQQRQIWRFVQTVTARALIKGSSLLALTEPTLKLQWEQQLRANETLR